jgi:hypothetical protein
MSRRKKRSIVAVIFLGLGTAIGWLIVNFFKAIWFLLVGLWTGISVLFKKTSHVAKEAHAHHQVKKEQPKGDAQFNDFEVAETTKGDFDTFQNRLFNESLILAIAGRRGSGKSVLGFRLMENINAKTNRACFALGVKQSVIPEWIVSITDIHEVKNGGIVLVDEGAISFGSRKSMTKENKGLADLLAIARHKDLTLIFITQNTGMIDKNVLNLCDTLFFKEGSLLQEKMERSVMKDLYATANKYLNKVPSAERKPYVYVVDAEFEGMIKTALPSFWSSKVSKNQA